jgi:hypothetical protein
MTTGVRSATRMEPCCCVSTSGARTSILPDEPVQGATCKRATLVFRVDDFDPALQRARALVPRLDEEPHLNPSTETRQFSLRDADRWEPATSGNSAARIVRLEAHVRADPWASLLPTYTVSAYIAEAGARWLKECSAESSLHRRLSSAAHAHYRTGTLRLASVALYTRPRNVGYPTHHANLHPP